MNTEELYNKGQFDYNCIFVLNNETMVVRYNILDRVALFEYNDIVYLTDINPLTPEDDILSYIERLENEW